MGMSEVCFLGLLNINLLSNLKFFEDFNPKNYTLDARKARQSGLKWLLKFPPQWSTSNLDFKSIMIPASNPGNELKKFPRPDSTGRLCDVPSPPESPASATL